MQISRWVFLLTGALCASSTYAIPVTWRATGTVADTPPPFLFPFTVAAGDSIDFDYRFDTAATCVMCESDQARYDNLMSSLVVRVNDAALEIPLTTSSLYLANDHAVSDGFLDAYVLTFSGTDADLGFSGTLALQNVFPSNPVTPLSSVALSSLGAPPDPQAFPTSALPDIDSNFFSFSVAMDRAFNSFGGELVGAGVLSPTSPPSGAGVGVAVPEPATITLMLGGLLGLFFAGRSRQQRGA